MKDRVLKIVSRVMSVPVKQLNEQSSIDTLEKWDSMRHMNLIMSLEEEFQVTFNEEEIIEMVSVEIILETLKNHL
ncbi:MAG TPA: acyl carrier protein [archaeon]|nr:acyl carrier protein [archaeon]